MKLGTLNRRTLLRGAGGVAIGLPLLEAMLPRRAHAAGPKRLVIFFTPNGTNDRARAIPSATGTGFTLPLETEPLAPLKNDLLVLSGISMKTADENREGDEHSVGMSHMLTCVNCVKADGYSTPGGEEYFVSFAGGVSVDQKIVQAIKPPTKLSSLEVGVQSILGIGAHPFSRMIYEDRLRPRPAQDDPREVFKQLFTGFTPPAGSGGPQPMPAPAPTPAPVVDQALERRRSILDYVLDDYKRLSTRLGGLDKRKVDGHLQGLRQIELQLATVPTTTSPASPAVTPGGGCALPADPAPKVTANAFTDQTQFPVLGKLQMDLLVMALACDLTRVASIQWSWARSTQVFSWVSQRDRHHDITHQGWTAGLGNVNRWYAEQLAYFGTALKSMQEGGGSVLDSTVVYWCSDVALGQDHSYTNLRTFLLGSAGGFFKTGQHIKFNNEPHNKLMVTLMRAMGIADANQFGLSTIAAGPLPGLG